MSRKCVATIRSRNEYSSKTNLQWHPRAFTLKVSMGPWFLWEGIFMCHASARHDRRMTKRAWSCVIFAELSRIFPRQSGFHLEATLVFFFFILPPSPTPGLIAVARSDTRVVIAARPSANCVNRIKRCKRGKCVRRISIGPRNNRAKQEAISASPVAQIAAREMMSRVENDHRY